MSAQRQGPPGPVPEPPPDLHERRLPLRQFSTVTWFRGHPSSHDPIYFNRTRGRWTDPEESFGTLYLGESEACAFIEAFNQQIPHSSLGYFVSQRLLDASCLCPVRHVGLLRLVDLTTGPNLRQIGADNRVCDGPHVVSRRWARALWEHPEQPHGVYYRSRLAPEYASIALFERPELMLSTDCTLNALSDVNRLALILDYFNCALLP